MYPNRRILQRGGVCWVAGSEGINLHAFLHYLCTVTSLLSLVLGLTDRPSPYEIGNVHLTITFGKLTMSLKVMALRFSLVKSWSIMPLCWKVVFMVPSQG